MFICVGRFIVLHNKVTPLQQCENKIKKYTHGIIYQHVYSTHLGRWVCVYNHVFYVQSLIVHCSGLSSGRERVRRARVIIALSLATCQYNLEAMRKDGREERGEERERKET